MKVPGLTVLGLVGSVFAVPCGAGSLPGEWPRDFEIPPGAVAWGDQRACSGPLMPGSGEPPPYRVPSPYVFEEGRIHKGSESCKLTAVKELDLTSGVGEYVADCTTAHDPDWRRQYTSRIALDGDTLSMVWKSTASPQTYPFATGPLRRCNLQPGKGKLPWQADRTKG